MKKIKAYTIVELLIAITVGSLIISFSVAFVLNISQIVDVSAGRLNKQIELLGLKEAIQNDLHQAHAIIESSPKSLVIKTTNNKIVEYTVLSERVVRETEDSENSTRYKLEDIALKIEKTEEYIVIRINSPNSMNSALVTYKYSPKHYFETRKYLKE